MIIKPLSELKNPNIKYNSSGHKSIDKLFGGFGIADVSINLIAGLQGIGKSALASFIAEQYSIKGDPVLYVSGEESLEQMKHRTNRLKLVGKHIIPTRDVFVDKITENALDNKCKLVIVDSTDSLRMKDFIRQSKIVDESVFKLKTWTEKHHIPFILINHVTKKGKIAGSKDLLHHVDGVFQAMPIESSHEKIVQSQKNRFGSTETELRFYQNSDGIQVFAESITFRTAQTLDTTEPTLSAEN